MKSKTILSFIILSFAITAVFIMLSLWVFTYFNDLDKSSKFGDTFGGINSFFSALAFAGVIYTILLQRDELSLQREEIKRNREELRRAANAQEKITYTSAISNMIGAYNIILDPKSGMKDNSFGGIKLDSNKIKVKLAKAITKIENLIEEKEL
ncbi:hypothetical protein HGB47_20630 [Leptospira yasudae]|uniref:hypothetical protein n=1 Tax=Leptospira yasudae TaxID=2202201 RepID=UPI001C4F9728|nr:hypothetical protein [Leptospira yasudae]MBW0436016.1 hypothetical protein [Leptospira yasudae]